MHRSICGLSPLLSIYPSTEVYSFFCISADGYSICWFKQFRDRMCHIFWSALTNIAATNTELPPTRARGCHRC